MLLAVDIGNSRSKAAVFEDGRILEKFVFSRDGLRSNLLKVISDHDRLTDIIVSSVGHESVDFDFPRPINIHKISHESRFPFRNLYETPKTLGIDRMILAWGATLQFPAKNRLVIDAGTCITYDFIDDKDRYHGGAISPGIRLRYEALHNYTAKLPLLNTEMPKEVIGKSTAGSIHSGVVNGVLNEIDGFIESYRGGAENFIIILTGGDADFLAGRLKNTIFANQNFLLESMEIIFRQNHK